jgi:hypothetical protein
MRMPTKCVNGFGGVHWWHRRASNEGTLPVRRCLMCPTLQRFETTPGETLSWWRTV